MSFGPNVAEPRPRAAKVERQGSTRRSSGWNRYWSGGSALNILGFGGNRQHESKRQTVESDRSSHYSADQHRITQDSATVPPLLQAPPTMPPDPKPKFQRVNSGSPTMANYNPRVKDEMRARIERPASHASELSGYSSGVPASVHDAWDPTRPSRPWGADRAPTNAYLSSLFTTGLNLPPGFGAPATTTTSTGEQHQHQHQQQEQEQEQELSRPPTGVSSQPQLALAATSSDMSWLNLGDFARL